MTNKSPQTLLDPLYLTPSPDHLQKIQAEVNFIPARASSPYAQGRKTSRCISRAYEELYTLLDAPQESSCLFCHSGYEAISHAIWGIYFDYGRKCGRGHLLTMNTGDGPTIMNFERLGQIGATHDLVDMDCDGRISLDALKASITPRTLLISLPLVHPLSGVIQPIDKIYELCQERSIYLHVDISSAWSQIPSELSSLQADILTLNGHHLGTLFGGGLICLRPGMKLSPYIPAGPAQLTYTDISPFCIWDLVLAMKEQKNRRGHGAMQSASLRRYFEEELHERLGAQVLFKHSPRTAAISLIAFSPLHAELLAYHLDQHQISFSMGGGSQQQLHYLLKSCHLPSSLYHSALSFYFDPKLSHDNLEEIIGTICDCVKSLQEGCLSMEVSL